MRLLLVGTQEEKRNKTQDTFLKNGYVVDCLENFSACFDVLERDAFDVAVFNTSPKQTEGIRFLKSIRRKGCDTPILFLSDAEDLHHRLKSLKAGADSYLTRPLDEASLIALVRAILRRRTGWGYGLVRHGEIVIDPNTQEVSYKGDRVSLGPKGYFLLKELLSHVDQVLSREYLELKLFGWKEEISHDVLAVHVHRLRKKLYSTLVRTVRGFGYVIEHAKS